MMRMYPACAWARTWSRSAPAREPKAFRLSVCPVWSLGRLVFSSVFSGFNSCHVTAAEMLPPLSGMFFVQRRVYRRVQTGSNLTSPLPPDPGFVGLRLTCGCGFASRRSGHRELKCGRFAESSQDLCSFACIPLRNAARFVTHTCPITHTHL